MKSIQRQRQCSLVGNLLTMIIGVKIFQTGQKADTNLHVMNASLSVAVGLQCCMICLDAAQKFFMTGDRLSSAMREKGELSRQNCNYASSCSTVDCSR